MKIVINHQKPEIKTAWQAANHSQIFPPRPALLTVFIVPSYLFVFRYNLLHTSRHRDVGKRRQTRLVAAPRRTLTSFSSREATLKLLKALVCQAERLDVTIHSSWQATGERGRVFFPLHSSPSPSSPPLFRSNSHWDWFSFDVVSCKGLSKGEIRPFVEDSPGRRRQRL